jgi:hypothetical protein
MNAHNKLQESTGYQRSPQNLPGGAQRQFAQDARYKEMGVVREELNIGQLCRQRFGNDVALIGSGTQTGTVAAATDCAGSPLRLSGRTGAARWRRNAQAVTRSAQKCRLPKARI